MTLTSDLSQLSSIHYDFFTFSPKYVHNLPFTFLSIGNEEVINNMVVFAFSSIHFWKDDKTFFKSEGIVRNDTQVNEKIQLNYT